jgi:hypothetical protein
MHKPHHKYTYNEYSSQGQPNIVNSIHPCPSFPYSFSSTGGGTTRDFLIDRELSTMDTVVAMVLVRALPIVFGK